MSFTSNCSKNDFSYLGQSLKSVSDKLIFSLEHSQVYVFLIVYLGSYSNYISYIRSLYIIYNHVFFQ